MGISLWVVTSQDEKVGFRMPETGMETMETHLKLSGNLNVSARFPNSGNHKMNPFPVGFQYRKLNGETSGNLGNIKFPKVSTRKPLVSSTGNPPEKGSFYGFRTETQSETLS